MRPENVKIPLSAVIDLTLPNLLRLIRPIETSEMLFEF